MPHSGGTSSNYSYDSSVIDSALRVNGNSHSSGLPTPFPIPSGVEGSQLPHSNASAFLTYRRPRTRTGIAEDLSLLSQSNRPLPDYIAQVNEEVVRGSTHIHKSAVLDVRPRRALHVTSTCNQGDQGGSCGATHCSLSAGLPLAALSSAAAGDARTSRAVSAPPAKPHNHTQNSSPEDTITKVEYRSEVRSERRRHQTLTVPSRRFDLDITALDNILEEVYPNMDSKTSTEWKSSFQNIQGKFKEHSGTYEAPGGLEISGASAILDLLRKSSRNNSPSPLPYGTLPRTIAKMDSTRWSSPSPPPSSSSSNITPGQRLAKSSSSQNVYSERSVSTNDVSPESKLEKVDFWNRCLQKPADVLPEYSLFPSAIKIREHSEFARGTAAASTLWASGARTRPSDIIRDLTKYELDFEELNAVVTDSGHSGTQNGQPEYTHTAPYDNKPGLLNVAVARKVESVLSKDDARRMNHKLAYCDYNPYKDRTNDRKWIESTNAIKSTLNTKAGSVAEIDHAIRNIDAIAKGMDMDKTSRAVPQADSVEVHLINEVSNFLHQNADILEPVKSINGRADAPTKARTFSELNQLVDSKEKRMEVKTSTDSPSPDALTSSSDTPIGLPYLKPKHHLREQLQNVGIEPRSPTGQFRAGLWMFPTHTGSVAERVMQFEKYPSPIHTIHVQQTNQPHVPLVDLFNHNQNVTGHVPTEQFRFNRKDH